MGVVNSLTGQGITTVTMETITQIAIMMAGTAAELTSTLLTAMLVNAQRYDRDLTDFLKLD